jgi:GntR family transcriptional regulator/MocR family aminotransferase
MDYRFLLAGEGSNRQRRLYGNLRSAISSGRLAANHRLPSSRELAEQLGIARNSVVYAFDQLRVEGYLSTSRRGTLVAAAAAAAANVDKPRRSRLNIAVSKRVRNLSRRERPRDDALPFSPGVPALQDFPLQEWHAVLRRTASKMRAKHLGYGEALGNEDLRKAIADRLRAARALRCSHDQIFITNGTQSTLDLLARSLADPGDSVWMEAPGYAGARAAFLSAGLKVEPVEVDEYGFDPEKTRRLEAPRFIYLTPSHQYPLGSVLSLKRRMELINRAWELNALILEDDYDSDFRFGGEPLPALQGLVEEAPVIYLGTFSKTMFPGLRLGYLVVPPAAVEAIATIYANLDRHGRQHEQMALASFITEGRYTRHLSRMRKIYRERQQALRSALAERLPELPVDGAEAGLHLVLRLPNGCDDVQLAHRARLQGLNPAALSEYGEATKPRRSGLVLGYGNLALAGVKPAVRTLAQLLRNALR